MFASLSFSRPSRSFIVQWSSPLPLFRPHQQYSHGIPVNEARPILVSTLPHHVRSRFVAFNVGAFISTPFLLQFTVHKFIKHAAVLACRISLSEVVIRLLTAGAEWEGMSGSSSLLSKFDEIASLRLLVLL